jgi:hypothetical protein
MTVDQSAVRVKLEELITTISRKLRLKSDTLGPTKMILRQSKLSRVDRGTFSVAKNPGSTSREQ